MEEDDHKIESPTQSGVPCRKPEEEIRGKRGYCLEGRIAGLGLQSVPGHVRANQHISGD